MTRTASTVVLSLLMVLLQNNHDVAADFGLPTAVAGGSAISSNANSINSVLNLLNLNLRRFNHEKQSGYLRSSSEKIAEMGQKIADLGKLITSNVSKAASDRSTPVKELFNTLQSSYERMSQYLKVDALVAMDSLNSELGNSLTGQLESALDGVSQAITNVTTVTETIEEAINRTIEAANGRPVNRGIVNANIPPNLTISMSKALIQLREQTAGLTKLIENVLKNIAFVDSYLVKVNTTALSFEQKVNTTLLGLKQVFPNEADSVVKRYYSSHNILKTEFSNAISKLSIFSSNSTLQALVDGFSEAYTKFYYYLYHRNQSDVDAILKSYDETVSNMDQTIQTLNANITTDMQQIAAIVGYQYLTQNPKYEVCFNRHQAQFTSTFTNINNAIVNCLNRERNRIGRLPGVVDGMLRLTEADTEDAAYHIGSCATYTGFASSPTTYDLALACLNTTLNQTSNLQQLIGQGYEGMLQLLEQEVANRKFRIEGCLNTRYGEGGALIEGLQEEVERCLNGETTRYQLGNLEDQVIDLTDTELEDVIVTEDGKGAAAVTEDNFFDEQPESILGNY